jgi:hypothetical protein
MDMRVLSRGARAVSLSSLYHQSGRLTYSVLSKCSATRIVCMAEIRLTKSTSFRRDRNALC